MRLACVSLGNLWAGGLFAVVTSLAHADSIYLSDAGRSNLDVIRLRIAPAQVFEDPLRRVPYIRGIVLAERGARNPSAPFNQDEGRPEYDIVAFDASGEKRSATVTINGTWINSFMTDFDSDLDVRWLFSNRDQVAGVALASRTYFAMARRALDPQGKLGFWRNDVALPPEPAGVIEGAVLRHLLDPPISDASGNTDAWTARKQAEFLATSRDFITRRVPLAHLPTYDYEPRVFASALIKSITQERAYRLSRAGFDRTALGMLVFLLDLAVVRHDENPIPNTFGNAVYLEGIGALEQAIITIQGATDRAVGHADPPALTALLLRWGPTTNVSAKREIAAEYNALQARLAATPRTSCPIHQQFCIDESQQAAVAIDALLASEALFASPEHAVRVAHLLLEFFAEDEDRPNPHRLDRVDLRDPAMRLLTQMLNPPTSPASDLQKQRLDCAQQVRRELFDILHDANSDEHPAVHRVLAAGGWGPEAELHSLADTLFDNALLDAASITRDPETGRFARARVGAALGTLRVLSELATSQVPAERTTANRILNRIDRMRQEQRDKSKANPTNAAFLEAWGGGTQ